MKLAYPEPAESRSHHVPKPYLHIHPSVTKTASFWSTDDIWILCVWNVHTVSVTDNTLPAGLKQTMALHVYILFYNPLQAGSRDAAVCIQTWLRAGRTGVWIPAQAWHVSLFQKVHRLGPTQLPTEWIPKFFPDENAAGE
jgi:hypothetical protein